MSFSVWLLAVGSGDLFQAGKEKTACKAEQILKNDNYDLMFGLNPFFLLYIFILFLKLQDSSIELFSFFLFTKITEGDHQTDVIERVNEIYTAVVQSEECMEKIACEVGALAGDVGLTQSPALK